jgi:hypothetical protein
LTNKPVPEEFLWVVVWPNGNAAPVYPERFNVTVIHKQCHDIKNSTGCSGLEMKYTISVNWLINQEYKSG